MRCNYHKNTFYPKRAQPVKGKDLSRISSRGHTFRFDSLVDSSLEVPGMRADDPMKPGNTWKILQALKSPRTIKSHLPVALLPKQLWTAHPKVRSCGRMHACL